MTMLQPYVGKNAGDRLMAVQVTEDELDNIAKATNGDVWVDTDGTRRILYSHPAMGEESAEIGDYVLTDGAGLFWPIDKEPFEEEYAQLYNQ